MAGQKKAFEALTPAQITGWLKILDINYSNHERLKNFGPLPRRNRKLALGFYVAGGTPGAAPTVRHLGLTLGDLVSASGATKVRLRRERTNDGKAHLLSWAEFLDWIRRDRERLGSKVNPEVRIESQVLFELEEGWAAGSGRKQGGAHALQPCKMGGRFWFQMPVPRSRSEGTKGSNPGHVDILARAGSRGQDCAVVEIKAPNEREGTKSALGQAAAYAADFIEALKAAPPEAREKFDAICGRGKPSTGKWHAIALVEDRFRGLREVMEANAKKIVGDRKDIELKIQYFRVTKDQVELLDR